MKLLHNRDIVERN